MDSPADSQALTEIIALLKSIDLHVRKIAAEVGER